MRQFRPGRWLAFAGLMACVLGLGGAVSPVQARGLPPAVQTGAMAVDPATGHYLVALPSSDAVFVMSSKDEQIITVLRVPPVPSGIAIDPVRRLTYVSSDSAGMISIFDSRSYNLVRIYPVGGHPSGLTLAPGGKSLLFADDESGNINRLSLWPKPAEPEQLLQVGPGALPQLGPRSVIEGRSTMLWARGFAPGEPVAVYWVYWGSRPLVRTAASAAGIVTVSVLMPAKVGTGEHMLILYGMRSARSQSVLLNVLPLPPAPKPRPKPRPRKPGLVDRLLAPSVVVPNPLAALGQKSAPKGKKGQVTRRVAVQHPAARAGLQVPIIAFAAVPLLLLMIRLPAMRRRRRLRKAEKAAQAAMKQKGGRRGRRSTPVKQAS